MLAKRVGGAVKILVDVRAWRVYVGYAPRGEGKWMYETHFGDACEWTGASVDIREQWLLARRKLITGSKVPALLGLSPYQDALDVYADMVCTDAPEPEVMLLNDPRFWGLKLERAIAETAAGYYGWKIEMGGGLMRSKRYPMLGATLDAEICADGAWRPYEGKTTAAWKFRDWDEETGTPPDYVIAQTQAQMLVTGAEIETIFCLIGGNRGIRIDVEPAAEFQQLIIETVGVFMDRVERLDPPPPGAKSKDALDRLFGRGNGTSVALPADAVSWTKELFDIRERMKFLTDRENLLKNMLRASIADHTYGILTEPVRGKSMWRWQTQSREGYTVQPMTTRVLLAMK